MINRRQTLNVVISSLLAPAFELSPFSGNASAATLTRNTDVACRACATADDLKNVYANVLDSAHIIKHASLPIALSPILRSYRAGLTVQFVESATGKLCFGIKDLIVKGAPSVSAVRYYNSGNEADVGLGKGWSLAVDDRITVSGTNATLTTAAYDVVNLASNDGGSTYSVIHPGLTVHAKLIRASQSTLKEPMGGGIHKEYTLINGDYHLSAIDYGEIGRTEIYRDTTGRTVSINAPGSGVSVELQWSTTGQLIGLRDSAGRSVTFEYANSLLISHRDVMGSKWNYEYLPDGISRIIDPVGVEILGANYDSTRVSETRTISGNLDYSYSSSNANGIYNLSTVDSVGNSTEYEHNNLGQVVAVRSSSDPSGNLLLTYDSKARLTQMIHGSQQNKYSYDSEGNLIQRSSGAYSRAWAYTANGKLSSTSDGAGKSTFEYDAAGHLASAASSRKIRSYSVTNKNGRPLTIQNSHRTLGFSYTPQGLLKTVTTQKSRVADFAYDKAGYLVSEKLSDGYTSSARRNARGQLTEWSDSRGRHFTFQRDSRGAVVKITNTKGDWARADRDTHGRIAKLTNSNGQSRTFVYNSAGRLVSWTDAQNRKFAVQYDPATGKALEMTQVNGAAKIVRGIHGEAVLHSSYAVKDAAGSGQSFDDGWLDPLFGSGLLGSFSGFTKYSASEIVKKSKSAVAVNMLVAESSDQGNTSDDDGQTDDDDDDDDDDDQLAKNNPDCSPCESAYQTTCMDTRLDSLDAAQQTEVEVLGGCALIAETVLLAAACAAGAVLNYNSSVKTAETTYTNCITLITQNCYSQCQAVA